MIRVFAPLLLDMLNPKDSRMVMFAVVMTAGGCLAMGFWIALVVGVIPNHKPGRAVAFCIHWKRR